MEKRVRLLIYWCSIAETDMATWFLQVDGPDLLTGCLVQRLHTMWLNNFLYFDQMPTTFYCNNCGSQAFVTHTWKWLCHRWQC